MHGVHILKLGGSILTQKASGRPTLRRKRIKEIAEEIRRAHRARPDMRLVLLHGAGSFGHPLAHRYKIANRPLSAHTLRDAGNIIIAMRQLNNELAKTFINAGIPVVPLQTSACAQIKKGVLHISNTDLIDTILKNGGIPLLGGDVVLADDMKTAICSADMLAVYFAKKFRAAKVLFAGDTDGVYATFPPKKGERPLRTLDRAGIKQLIKNAPIKGFVD